MKTDEKRVNDNIDDPNRHNIGGSMNRPPRNDDPLSPRNIINEELSKTGRVFYFEEAVDEVLTELHTLLIAKNEKYGNSALEPKRIFSQANPVEQIKVRIDDKLSRIANGNGDLMDEDTVMDLLGYLILLKIAQKGK